MKIGFFTDSYKPYMSGVVKSIESFTAQFRRAGHDVYIFAPDYPGIKENPDLEDKYIYRFKSIPAMTHPGFRLAIPISAGIIQEVKKLDLDIIHTHSPFLMGWLGRIVAHRLNIPLVFTYHTLYEEYAHYAPLGEELIRKLAINYSRSYCQSCDLVITPSDFVEQMLNGYNINTPLLTVSTGIDLKPYQERTGDWIREEYQIDENEQLLLFVGRFGQEKNLQFLLNSFEEITDNLPRVKLVLVGDGPQCDTLKSMVESMNLDSKTIFAGWQPPEKVVDFYLASDLFVFPSMTETQGLVTLEAMAGGLPVVAVDAAGSTVMVDHALNGFLTKSDEHYFAQAVIDLLTHQKRYQMYSKNAIKKAQEYSMEKMAERLLNGYHDLLDGDNYCKRYLA